MNLVLKKPRYITLLGDDISKGTATRILESNETLFASLGALFMAASDNENAIENIISIMHTSIFHTMFNRLIMERACLNKFSPGSFFIGLKKTKRYMYRHRSECTNGL